MDSTLLKSSHGVVTVRVGGAEHTATVGRRRNCSVRTMSKRLKILSIAAGVGVVVYLLLFPHFHGDRFSKPTLLFFRCQSDMTTLMIACKAYRTEYNANPTGDMATLLAILKGNNTRHVVFIDLPNEKINKRGEFIDPWGTPFEVSFVGANGQVRIRSAGPDKKFGDKDDVNIWDTLRR